MPTNNKIVDVYNKHAVSWKKNITQRNSFSIFYANLEKLAMYSKLPNLINKDVLCVGCGTGEEVEYLHKLGTKSIIRIDVSETLIKIAKKRIKREMSWGGIV